MDGLLVLLALAALAAVILGPIGFFAAMGHGGRLRNVERALDDVRQRLMETERRLASGAGPTTAQAQRAAEFDASASAAVPLPEDLAASPPPVAPTAADLPPPIPVSPPPMATAAAEPPPLPEAVAAAETSEPPANPPPPRASLEERLGARWTVWVGGIATALGALLLVRYAAEEGYFGPGARVLLGLALAAVLLGLGEWLRRAEGALPALGSAAARANAPAVLTGAGVVAAFGSVYAAHALYGFIGAAPAFLALGAVGLAALALASLHGPALAGLGLVGAEAAPLLVSSDHPSPWPVVLYLAPVAIAAYALARLRRWLWLALATAGGGFAWSFLLSGQSHAAHALDAYHAALAMLVSQAALAAAFMAVAPHRGGGDEEAGFDPAASGVLAAFAALSVLAFYQPPDAFGFDAWWIACAGALVAVLAITGVVAATVASAIALAGALAVAALALWPAAEAARALDLYALLAHWRWPPPLYPASFIGFALAAGLGVAAFAAWRLLQGERLSAPPAIFYAGAAGLTPLAAILAADARIADGAPSLTFAGAASLLAGFYAFAASRFQRGLARGDGPATRLGLGAMASGAIAALAAGLVFALDGGALTVSLSLAALATAYVSTRLDIPALRWCVAGFGVAVAARLAWEPRVVGAALSPTPIFNWLLFGYGAPGLAFGLAARLMRARGEDTPVRVADALAVLFSAFLVFFEIRHATNGGDPFARGSGLIEQGLMAVSSFGFALVLTRLDAARANPVFRGASLAAGALGGGVAAISLLLRWNPFFDNVPVEGGTLVNALLLSYGLPAALAAGLAFAARRVRPSWYWGGAGVVAAALATAYLFLQLRVFFHGMLIDAGEGFTLSEFGFDAAAPLALAAILEATGAPLDRAGRLTTGLFALSAAIGVGGLALAENPLLTDEPIAGGAAINALLVAFALPGALTAWLGRRLGAAPMRLAAILWFFAYVSLETRRCFHGATIGEPAGVSDGEIYAYSAVWLALGLALLAYGVARSSREARYASTFFVVATTLKVFLYDLSGLEGALRAFSFIGLGLALIAIGLVYQKLVFAPARAIGGVRGPSS
jgi:uncharacterized membrane protein